jgi:hypothetical protein
VLPPDADHGEERGPPHALIIFSRREWDMKFFRIFLRAGSALFLLFLAANPRAFGTQADEKLQKVVKQYLPFLEQISREKNVISDVLIHDASPLSPDQIQRDQEEWKKIGISDFKQTILFSQSSDVIRQYEPRLPLMIKCFVLDQQGDVVGAVPQSNSFAHGKMDKFLKSFNHGLGRIYVNEPGLDISTHIYSVQVSLPIFSGGQTIGVLTATLSLE